MRHILTLSAGVLLGFTGMAEDLGGNALGLVLLVVFAVVTGFWAPELALGYAVTAAIRDSDPGLPVWWVLPAIGAFAVRLLAASDPGWRLRQRFRYHSRLKAELSGVPGRPVEPVGRLVSAVSWLLVWLPLSAAVAVVVLGSPLHPALMLAAGGLATAACWAGRAATRAMSRYDRRGYLTVDIGTHLGLLLVVTADPDALPRDASDFAVTTLAMVLTQVLVTTVLSWPARWAWPVARGVGSIVGGTWLAYACVVQPSTPAAWASILTSLGALGELTARQIPADASPLWWTRVLSAQNFRRDNTSYDAHVAQAWLNDEVRSPTGLALPHTMAALAVVCLTGRYGKYRWPEYAQRRWPPADAAISEGKAWLDAADDLVDAAEPYAAPDAVVRARADCALSRGQVLEAEANWTGAEAAYRTAASGFTEAGLPDFAALARLFRARVLAERLDRVAEAETERGAIAADSALLAPTRRWAGAKLPEFEDHPEYRKLERAADRPPIIDLGRRTPPWSPLVSAAPPVTAPAEAGGIAPSLMPADGPAQRLVDRGMERWRRGRHAEAAEDLRTAAELLERNSQQLIAMDVLMELARVQTDVDPSAAFDTLEVALRLQERFRDEVVDERLRLRINGWFEVLHTRQIALLATASGAGWPERPAVAAFDLAERARSRLLLEQLGDTADLRADALPTALVRRERDQLAEVRRRRAAMGTPGERVRALAAVRAARERLAETWREVAATGAGGAEYAQMRRGDPLRFAEVEPLLGQALLAEYHVTEDAVVVLLARAGAVEPTMVRVPLARATLARVVGDVFSAVHTAEPSDWQVLSPLVEPLVRHSSPGQVIWIVPHDVLHGVPLHAFEADGEPLVARNPVCYTSAAAVMRYCQAKRRTSASGSVVLADSRAEQPLSHSRAQSGLLCTLLDRPTRLVGPDATVARMTAATRGGVSVLHLACHGEFDAERPARSRVLLAADGSDDGLLTAERILGMELSADLVTLSACRSGLAHRRPGDELFGLTRALIYAGASAVLVSLWAVDEVATGLLMYSFYRARRAGEGKAAALRTAQLAVREATLAEVVGYCTRVGGEHRVLARELADARFRARDFAAAADAYAELLESSDGDSEDDRRLRSALARATLARQGHAEGPDHTRRIYAHPYHWAGFVLIGDWR
ncbi:CHAT domain-containing protein [Streptomyces muensis]|uniref:CHAT domain-containing protein n=1 Tax=Streptomyces muensis TaxID=1077944 RepID=A0A9X1TJ83_STRM4|nr:CHAT domain-containing protein [Streptomyces muensis]MCF1594311.1 CHAT domain-containing protein [Streptomyces muensis]